MPSFVNTSSVTFNLSSSVAVLEPYLHFSFTKVEDNRSQVQSQKGILWIASSQHFLHYGGYLEGFEVSAIRPAKNRATERTARKCEVEYIWMIHFVSGEGLKIVLLT